MDKERFFTGMEGRRLSHLSQKFEGYKIELQRVIPPLAPNPHLLKSYIELGKLLVVIKNATTLIDDQAIELRIDYFHRDWIVYHAFQLIRALEFEPTLASDIDDRIADYLNAYDLPEPKAIRELSGRVRQQRRDNPPPSRPEKKHIEERSIKEQATLWMYELVERFGEPAKNGASISVAWRVFTEYGLDKSHGYFEDQYFKRGSRGLRDEIDSNAIFDMMRLEWERVDTCEKVKAQHKEAFLSLFPTRSPEGYSH